MRENYDTVTRRTAGKDVSRTPLDTIDGETAKVSTRGYCEPRAADRCVAIADVSHYGKHGEALDRAANRGNSVYFPRRDPMLRRDLEGLCSLEPKVRARHGRDWRSRRTAHRIYEFTRRCFVPMPVYRQEWRLLEDGGRAARRTATAAARATCTGLQTTRQVAERAARSTRDHRDREDLRRRRKIGSSSRCGATRAPSEQECCSRQRCTRFPAQLRTTHMLYGHEGPTRRSLGPARIPQDSASRGGGDQRGAGEYAKLSCARRTGRPQLLQTVRCAR